MPQLDRRPLFTLAIGLLSLLPRLLPAQTPVLELDHLYIVVTPPVAPAAQALRRAGIVLDTEPHRHVGQGTASIAAFFENAYLELLWVDSTVPVDSAHRADVDDFRRAGNWLTSAASPFGLGLHFRSESLSALAIPTRREPAPHLGPNCFYLLLRQPVESLATDTFIMPAPAAVTQWLSRFRDRRPALFAHALGARRITRVVLYGSPANRPRAAALAPQPVDWGLAATPYAIVEFDGGLSGKSWDLRPALPLILRR